MAEKSPSRDPDSTWVLAGGEGLPIDTVGPEQDSASHSTEDEEPEEEEGPQDTVTAVATNGAAAGPDLAQHPESSELGDPEERWDPTAGAVPPLDGSAEPAVPEGDEQEEPEAELGPCPDTPKAGPPTEEGSCTSSDDDTERLWQQQGHEPHSGPPRSASAPHRGPLDTGDKDGLNMSKCLLAVLVLMAVGLLIISGGIYDAVDDPVKSEVIRDVAAGEQESPLPAAGNDSQQKLPPSDTGDPQSVQSVSLLLDKLAKENQEIRLMQAELQTHKEELHALLQKSEGEAAAAGAQQQSLAAENARLRAALEQEAAALRDARAELQRLRAAGTPGSPGVGEPVAEQPPGAGAPARGEGAARRHGWLASVRQELAGVLERARGPGGLKGLLEELSALEQRLGWELEADGVKSFPGPWKKPYKAEKKENRRQKRHSAGGAPHEREKREQGKPHRHGKDSRPPREHKPGKTWGKSSHSSPQHSPRELPRLNRYRAPQGCSGVADCARKEGREVLGAALEPVQKAEFLRLLEGFMGRLGWGGYFGGLAAQLDGAFGADGAFAHDRLRFVDFVDDVEELLEEVARRERGDEEAADGFEEYVLRHYGGTAGKEPGRRAARQHGTGG
ncbi:pre-B-cell leukemia transcription factor-interacting protein 1 [Strix uralensis]|uniref:pre-B-cell leukemia transcription factor-interacting protein 1 n=1 Tax=Strix uralensis TaxID=36305 RepID=UPI003DA79361